MNAKLPDNSKDCLGLESHLSAVAHKHCQPDAPVLPCLLTHQVDSFPKKLAL